MKYIAKFIRWLGEPWLERNGKYDFIWLLHYMSGTGQKMTLPQAFFDECKDWLMQAENGVTLWSLAGEYADETGDRRVWHRMLGKFLVRRQGRIFHILDYYIFYPDCYGVQIGKVMHRLTAACSSNFCNCDDRCKPDWPRVCITKLSTDWFKLPKPILYLLFKLTRTPTKWMLDKHINIGPAMLDFTALWNTQEFTFKFYIRDEWFAKHGKPFYTTGHFIV
jgi:hypothetical protein